MGMDSKDDPHMDLNDYLRHVYSIKPTLELLACRPAEEGRESCSLENHTCNQEKFTASLTNGQRI